MSIFHASFQKARSGMLTNICEIEKVEELTDEEYERFSQNLTVSSELLSQESDRFRVDEHGIAKMPARYGRRPSGRHLGTDRGLRLRKAHRTPA